jgi:hypothetical protein
MENKETNNNLSAQSFFEENAIAYSLDSNTSEFKEGLRDQVLQKYLTFEDDTIMEGNTKLPVSKASFFKSKIFFLSATLLGLVIIITTAVLFVFPSIKKNQIIRGEVAYIEGNVFYKTLNSDWQKATVDTVIEQGFELQVIGNGKTILNLDDGSSVRLNENTSITLTSLNPEHIIITNDKGEVYSRVMKAERTFDVVANGITYRSMGTAYKTLCLDSTDNFENEKLITVNAVEVYESKVRVLGMNTDNEIIIEQGSKYYVVNLDSPELTQKVIEVDLSEIKSDEFVMWNKEQDEKIQAFKSQMGVLFDIKAPTLNLASPMDGEETSSPTILVSGSTDKDTKITVNSTDVLNNNGSFSYEFILVPGPNGIKVIAEDSSGNKSVRNLTVQYLIETTISPTTIPGVTKAPTSIPTPKITLYGTKVNDGVSFTWNVTGLDVSKGFKLVKSLSSNPVYPGNDYQYLTNGNQRSYTWNVKDGKTYHFRICQYNGSGTCLVYSNDITVQAPDSTPSNPVTGISLSVTGPTSVAWNVTSGIASNGFKVVWSKNSNPEYPSRSGDKAYFQSGTTSGSYGSVDAFNGYGTYYVRVCAYANGTGGSCYPYSNQVTINFVAPTDIPTPTPTTEPTPII